jgi:hypothetical protein
MIKKSITLFIYLFFIFQFSFCEVLNLKKNVKNNEDFIFKPLKLLRVIDPFKRNDKSEIQYFLIGENNKFKNVAINLTIKNLFVGSSDSLLLNGLYINGHRYMNRLILSEKLLSTPYIIKLSRTKIIENDFIKVSNNNSIKSISTLVEKYHVDYILDNYWRSDYIFSCIEPIECEDPITFEELCFTSF